MRKKDEIVEIAREAGWDGDEPKTIAEAISLLVSASSPFDTETVTVYPHGKMEIHIVDPTGAKPYRSGKTKVDYPDFVDGDVVVAHINDSRCTGTPDIGDGMTTLALMKGNVHAYTVVFEEATNEVRITVVSDDEPDIIDGTSGHTYFQFHMLRRVTELNARLETLIKELMDSYKPSWYEG